LKIEKTGVFLLTNLHKTEVMLEEDQERRMF